MKISPISAGIPRPIEAVIAMVGLLLLSPVLLLASLFILLTSRGPILFCQRRIGYHGRVFLLYKFRTMKQVSDGPRITASDDSRKTSIGCLLRKTKIDELPELWNVCRGDMSLVGPRPEVPQFVDLDDPLWRAVLMAKPGITDPVTLRLRNEEDLLSQVEGDRERFYRETLQPFKLKGYMEYSQQRCWQSDFVVLWKTVVAIVLPRSAVPPTLTEMLS